MSGHSYIGNTKIKHVYYGTTKIKKIYAGTRQVWSGASVVTYHVDSGVTETREVDEGLSILTYTPTKSGYTFIGWRDDTAASSEVLTTKVATGEPMTVYAVFAQVFTATFNGNGATGGSVLSQTVYRYYNNGNQSAVPTIVIPSNGYTKTDYTFYRWSIGSALYKPNDTISVSSNLSFNAYWLQTTTDFAYIGGIHAFTALAGVTYLLKTWGGQGGIAYHNDTRDFPQPGGYAQGYKTFNSNTTLYVCVGGQGLEGWGYQVNYGPDGGYNGGGTGNCRNNEFFGSGGGATHIGLENNLLKDTQLSNLLICAGGAGGNVHAWGGSFYLGGVGGGLNGGNGGYRGGYWWGDYKGGGQTGDSESVYGQGKNARGMFDGSGAGGGYYGGRSRSGGAGGGGSAYIDGVDNGSTESGVRYGDGYAQIVVSAVS